MSNYVKIAMMALCLVLGSCGQTKPYEKWLTDDPDNDPERLRPSELKSVLCEVGAWVVDYDGTDVYFQFGEDWSLTSDSEIPEVATSSTYNLMALSAQTINLKLVGAGHLSYINNNVDESYVVSEFSKTAISATGKDSGKKLSFVPADPDALTALATAKEALQYTVDICNEFAAAGFGTAAVHNADGDFVCRFAINAEPRNIQFDVIAEGVLTHSVVSVAANEEGNLDFESPITLGGKTVTGLLSTNDGAALKGGDGLKVTSNAPSRVYYLGGDYDIHALNLRDGRGSAVQYVYDEIAPHDEWGDIELNNRETRPLVFCPNDDKGRYWYTFFDSFSEETGANVSAQYNDIIIMTKSEGTMPFGCYQDENGDDINVAPEIESGLPRFMNGYFHKDGLILVHDSDGEYSYMWALSPTTDFWIRARS